MRKYVTIRYNSRFGPDDQKILNLKAKQVQLRNHGATSVDLSEIKDITQLQRIDIACNKLSAIDLSPIAYCKNLRYLDLSENNLTEIDLSPISKCTKLMRLDLSSNLLTNVDLDPLYHNRNLHTLYLQHNNILRLNITPLILLAELNHANLEGFKTVTLEVGQPVTTMTSTEYHVEPLLKTMLETNTPAWLDLKKLDKRIKTISYEKLVSTHGWNTVKDRLRRIIPLAGSKVNFELQKILLNQFGMPELACYDGDLSDIIELIPEDKNYSDSLGDLYLNLLVLLKEQLDRDGSTLHFDIDKLADKQSSVLIPILLEKRQKEMKNIRLEIQKSRINLAKLWQTGYGHEILSALGMRKTVNRDEFLTVKNAFLQAGIKLKVT
ncbi:MAG: leucine-rich repeat domain-containing protein [Candidatus Thorarchaeota archaeon]